MRNFTKTHIILLSALIIQLAAIAVIYGNGHEKKPNAAENYLKTLSKWSYDRLTQVSVSDERGKTIILTKNDAGTWGLPIWADYPLNMDFFSKNIETLLNMNSPYLVSRQKEQEYEREVAENHFRRRIQLVSKERELNIYIGNAGSSSYTHVRLDGSPEIWGVFGLSEWQFPTDPWEWAAHEYVNIAPEKLTYIALDGTSLEWAVSKTENGTWNWPGRLAVIKAPPNQQAVEQIINDLASIEMSTPLGPITTADNKERLNDAELITITLRAGEGTTLFLWPNKGDKSGESSLLYRQGASHLVAIDNWQIKALLELIEKERGQRD